MNKWQKVINQYAKDDEGFVPMSYRQRRIGIKNSIKHDEPYNFEEFLSLKNWNKTCGREHTLRYFKD